MRRYARVHRAERLEVLEPKVVELGRRTMRGPALEDARELSPLEGVRRLGLAVLHVRRRRRRHCAKPDACAGGCKSCVYASSAPAVAIAANVSPMPSITTMRPSSNGHCASTDHACARWCDSSCCRGSRLNGESADGEHARLRRLRPAQPCLERRRCGGGGGCRTRRRRRRATRRPSRAPPPRPPSRLRRRAWRASRAP